MTFRDMIITVNVNVRGGNIRDNIKGGALTETTLLVLLAACEPRHGYGIMQFIERETDGRVLLGAGTLYGALETLTKKGWIAPAERTASGDKKNYAITNAGRETVRAEQKRLAGISRLAAKMMGGDGL